MADKKGKDAAREIRLSILRSLGLGSRYQRTHTPTGVFRRKDLIKKMDDEQQIDEDKPRNRINARSLANLQKRRSKP